ncbi:MAG: tetratricopeptide repeat protein [Verrucomicrobia bacterium]|nr:tetratricopeptide repeat protein [Verrucomicrobiota bacterium]
MAACVGLGPLVAGPLEEADLLFKQTHYRRALALYEEARDAGLSTGEAEAGAIACLMKLGRTGQALERARALVQRFPKSGGAAGVLADVCFMQGLDGEAVATLERALKQQSNSASLRNSLAWILATTPAEAHRNGPRAVQLATGLTSNSRSTQADYQDTLAAAYAEVGRFAEAIRLQEQAMPELLRDRTYFHHRSLARQRLAAYRANRPWHRRPLPSDP